METILPEISFQRINPTKYKIKVVGAKNPYQLIFLETYHSDWKLYPVVESNGNEKLSDSVWQKFGELGKTTTSLFLKEKVSEVIGAEYFEGEIKEYTPRLIFMEPSTFETWGAKPIPEERHSKINGFANNWLVLPADTNEKENYEMIMEFNLQKIFYFSAIVTVTTFLILLVIIAVRIILEKKK